MVENFVETMKRDYIGFMPKNDAFIAIAPLTLALEHCNECHPHSLLGYRSPRKLFRGEWPVFKK